MRFCKLLVPVLLLFTLSTLALAQSTVGLTAGHSHMATLVAQADTPNWGGIIVTQDFTSLSQRIEPFMAMTLDTPSVYQIDFPGVNLIDGNHYYMATFEENFQLPMIRNVSYLDIQEYGMFSSEYAPTFYPNFNIRNDNPNKTFCCEEAIIPIAGVNFTSFRITLENDVDYYVLKYGDGDGTPIFLSEIEAQSCYDSTPCTSEFMLPVSPDHPYHFYALNKKTYYLYNITIDDVWTTTIPQTALVYKLWVRVYNAMTLLPAPNTTVIVGEDKGQNIFIPYRLEGYVSRAYSVGLTDENGEDEFLVAPTVYPSIGNYTLYVGVLIDDMPSSMEELTVTSRDSLIYVSKPIEPSSLYDNAKVSVNAMNQINNYLFKWSSQMLQARQFTLTYNLGTSSYTVSEVGKVGPRNLTLKTGAPNVILVAVLDGGMPQADYSVGVKEQGGYLIMDPYTASEPFTEKTRVHTQTVPSFTEFIVTPTSIGVIQSNITIQILNPDGTVRHEIPALIESSLAVGTGGSYYNNDLMKTIVNAMNSVLNSMFYSLNN